LKTERGRLTMGKIHNVKITMIEGDVINHGISIADGMNIKQAAAEFARRQYPNRKPKTIEVDNGQSNGSNGRDGQEI